MWQTPALPLLLEGHSLQVSYGERSAQHIPFVPCSSLLNSFPGLSAQPCENIWSLAKSHRHLLRHPGGLLIRRPRPYGSIRRMAALIQQSAGWLFNRS